jgi:hypothetical protein
LQVAVEFTKLAGRMQVPHEVFFAEKIFLGKIQEAAILCNSFGGDSAPFGGAINHTMSR